MRFPSETASIPACRHAAVARAADAGATPEALETVALLTTEAVTNAVLHCPDNDTVDLEVEPRGDHLHVVVSDEGARSPVLSRPGPTAPGGRGVMLIDLLATAWGVITHGTSGKSVWFDVPLRGRLA